MWLDLERISSFGSRSTRIPLSVSLQEPSKPGAPNLCNKECDSHTALSVCHHFSVRTDNGELLNLIDATGCPVNELIFPALNLEDASRALAANFKAFRFPSTPTVNFVATVQFCQDVCDPVSCTGETFLLLHILTY